MKINEELVNGFAEQTNMSVFKNAYAILHQILTEAMTVILSRSALIKNYEIMVANEVFSGTEFSGSNLDLFLVLDAKQLEVNVANDKSRRTFNQSVKYFWSEFLRNFKLFGRKNKKLTEKKLKKQENKILNSSIYTLKTFYNDLQLQLCKLLPKTTKTFIKKNCITILDTEQLGVTINVYPVFKQIINNENCFVIYYPSNLEKEFINFGDRANNFDLLNIKTKSLYKIQIRIFNSIFYNIMGYNPNQVFIESLLYNVPQEFYTYNIYETTKIIVNYLQNIDVKKFISICNINTLLFEEHLNSVNFETAYRFIKSINLD